MRPDLSYSGLDASGARQYEDDPSGIVAAGGFHGGPRVSTHVNVPSSSGIPIVLSKYPVPWSTLILFVVLVAVIGSGFVSFLDW